MSKASAHVKRGVVIHSSEQAARKIVSVIKKRAGKSYPAFFSTDIGKAIEAPLLCMLVHEAASRFELPYGAEVQQLAGYALEGCSGDLVGVAKKFVSPLVADLGGMALMLAGEEEEEEEEEDE
jgi:hypothetical protein